MLGFLIGTLSLIGLVKVLRRGRGFGGRFGFGAYRHAMRDGRFGFLLRGLFERLDTSPGQEKVARGAAEDVMRELKELRRKLWGAREDLASALRATSFDETGLRNALEAHDADVARVREAIVGSAARLHEALDERQRAELADLLSAPRGFGFARGFHAYR